MVFDPERLVGRLATAHRPAEDTFLRIGERLAETAAVLPTLQAAFGGLLKEVTENEAVLSVIRIKDAFEKALSGGPAVKVDELNRLSGLASELEQRVAALEKVVTEFGMLSVNARIQAAQIRGNADEFSVFTTEVARLGTLARERLSQIGDRIRTLKDAIHTAGTVAEAFMREGAKELALIRGRVEDGAAILADRQKRIALNVEAISGQSKAVGEEISAVIGSLQINDITSQRIEHVRSALQYASDTLDADDVTLGRPLGAVCRLQAVQLERTVADFDTNVARFVESLKELANAAEDLGQQIEKAVAGRVDGSSFVVDLEAQLRRVRELLLDYHAAQQRTDEIIATVSSGFNDVAREIVAIDSLEVDLRVVALNATLKCARLGSAGRTLGVVAQELRTGSRRAEAGTRDLSVLVTEVIALADALDEDRSRRGADATQELLAYVGAGVEGLTAFAGQVGETVAQVRTRSRQIAALLRDTGASVGLGTSMIPALRQIADELHAYAKNADPDAIGGIELPDHVIEMLSRSYTMDSERDVHAEILGSHAGLGSGPAPAQASEDLEDIFFS